MKNNKKINRIKIAAILLAILCVGFYSGLTVRNYKINSDQLINKNNIRIVVIADLHSTIYGNNQKPLVSLISKQSPDIIILAGDIIDAHRSFEGMDLLLNGIKNLAPIYYVTGNNEYTSGKVNEIESIVKSYGVTILDDNYQLITEKGTPLLIAGINDPDKKQFVDASYNQKNAMDAAFSKIKNIKAYKILVAHRPEKIDLYRTYGFDLILSGHAHGGQVRIPLLLNGLYAPNQGLFPKYVGGLYNFGKTNFIISRGLSFFPLIPRFFDPPEIAVIDLLGKK